MKKNKTKPIPNELPASGSQGSLSQATPGIDYSQLGLNGIKVSDRAKNNTLVVKRSLSDG